MDSENEKNTDSNTKISKDTIENKYSNKVSKLFCGGETMCFEFHTEPLNNTTDQAPTDPNKSNTQSHYILNNSSSDIESTIHNKLCQSFPNCDIYVTLNLSSNKTKNNWEGAVLIKNQYTKESSSISSISLNAIRTFSNKVIEKVIDESINENMENNSIDTKDNVIRTLQKTIILKSEPEDTTQQIDAIIQKDVNISRKFSIYAFLMSALAFAGFASLIYLRNSL